MTTIHKFESTVDAYDACQCCEEIKNGDILLIESEQVVGIAHTWPFALTPNHGALHRLAGGHTAAQKAKQDGYPDNSAEALAIAAQF